MRVEVLLFGAERDAAGRDRAAVDFPGASATCEQVRDSLAAQIPALRPHLAVARFAINGAFATPESSITAEDEVALIGLVSGG